MHPAEWLLATDRARARAILTILGQPPNGSPPLQKTHSDSSEFDDLLWVINAHADCSKEWQVPRIFPLALGLGTSNRITTAYKRPFHLQSLAKPASAIFSLFNCLGTLFWASWRLHCAYSYGQRRIPVATVTRPTFVNLETCIVMVWGGAPRAASISAKALAHSTWRPCFSATIQPHAATYYILSHQKPSCSEM